MKAGVAILLGVGTVLAGWVWWLNREPAWRVGQQLGWGLVVTQVEYRQDTRRWYYTILDPEGTSATLTRQQLDALLAQYRQG
jgi:hypothetical protein